MTNRAKTNLEVGQRVWWCGAPGVVYVGDIVEVHDHAWIGTDGENYSFRLYSVQTLTRKIDMAHRIEMWAAPQERKEMLNALRQTAREYARLAETLEELEPERVPEVGDDI